MTGFLEEVARDLYARYGEELSERTVLFPSRRARLFFTDALSRIVGRPVWQPAWSTIDELTAEISGLRTGDRLRLVAELYKVYSRFHREPFDKFYFWGEMLLADFDTIDKYRIDASQLFRNLSDLKEIEADISYLTPRQLEIIRNFWSTLGPEADLSAEKRKFLELWKTLGPIYELYRARLSELGIAYGGMVQRAAADRIEAGEYAFPEPRRYVVAGFNALSECEKILFRFLQSSAETDFYWDYDTYYKDRPEQEAGMFVRENAALFPPRPGISHDGMSQPKELTAVSVVSNAVQCKYAAEILRDYARRGPLDKRTAVVLTDENLLLPLLYALPEEVGKVNVTMGFPLKQSLAYTFVERLVALQAHGRTKQGKAFFYHADAAGLLSHPYVSGCDERLTRSLAEEIVRERRISVDAAWLGRNELLQRIFRPAPAWRELSDWLSEVVGAVARIPYAGEDARRRTEFLAVIAEEIVKLRNSLDLCDIDPDPDVYASLLRRHLQTIRIPFEGEPLEGLQVMGILETRNLDFENVVILSMNDDNFPGNRMTQASFVPYNLRAAFELPTPEHHEGVYAYYFYRLIQRARRVHMLYCSHADEKSTGEPSRYIYQLAYESGIPVERVEVGVDVNLARTAPIEVAKDPQVMARLERFVDPESPATLSPTALFRYVACPLRFYFHSVARLSAENEVTEEVDAPMFGTILHAAAQKIYGRILGEAHPGGTLQALSRTDEVAAAVVGAINAHYLRDETASPADYTGNLLLVKDIVTRYLRGGVMRYDAAHDAFTTTGLEEEVSYAFPFEAAGRALKLKFSGIADRIDRLDDGTLRVVDYKTGTAHLEFDGVECLFHGKGEQRLSNVLQTLLYSMMLYRSRGCDTCPTLYYVRKMHSEDYSPELQDKELKQQGLPYSAYAEVFEAELRAALAELYDPAVPFRQCEDTDTCQFCDFKAICKR
ncbi:MAG: PD-(D/E)XK nuclease family protein [Alistipes sp.]|nr:PD-(D/E)XK nuclease family protein [Alistipes senegalensis]MCM1250219.1 PD-(D/E)XK nuclease family protein [Alistipes sp.]